MLPGTREVALADPTLGKVENSLWVNHYPVFAIAKPRVILVIILAIADLCEKVVTGFLKCPCSSSPTQNIQEDYSSDEDGGNRPVNSRYPRRTGANER